MIENKKRERKTVVYKQINLQYIIFLPLLFRNIENVEDFFFCSSILLFSFSYLLFSLFNKQTCNTSLLHLSAAKNKWSYILVW